MNRARMFIGLLRVLLPLSCAGSALCLPVPAWAQGAQDLDDDRAAIAQMSLHQLALSILSVRRDLQAYSRDDLTTTSGQYELFYDDTTGPCKRRKDPTRPYVLCAGASLDINFLSHLRSNRRICPEPETGSCWKPALTEDEMRAELLELVRAIGGQRR